MESNGKRVTRNGEFVGHDTGAILWGGTGTSTQHAFFQLLHQGTHRVSMDFLMGLEPICEDDGRHRLLVANCIAQAEALMRGRSQSETRQLLLSAGHSAEQCRREIPHRTFPGNTPTNMIVYPKLTPRVLGALIALYEHKVFVQGILWQINSFDQWGVELGKQLAETVSRDLAGVGSMTHDSSTQQLIDRYRRHHES